MELRWFMLMAAATAVFAELETVHEWRYLDYLWNSEDDRNQAISNGEYDFGQNVPMDVHKAPDGRVFMSILGRNGVPARLVTVTDIQGPGGPLLQPYPDWSWFEKGNCNGIASVYRIAIDACNRLWVLDTGIVEGNSNVSQCPAQLLSFDLSTDKLIERIVIPYNIAGNWLNETLLSNPIVQTDGPNCENTTVYMADTFGFGMVIWTKERLFRLEAQVFKPVGGGVAFEIDGVNFNFTGGILGMSLTPKSFQDEPQYIVFRPLASHGLYAADTRVLSRSTYGDKIKFDGVPTILPSQAVGQAFSSEGTLFLGLTTEMAVACYNRYLPLQPENFEIPLRDSERLQYINALKVIYPSPTTNTEELWILSNKFHKFSLGTLSVNDTNFRIMKIPVIELTVGNKCDMPADIRNAAMQSRSADSSHEEKLIFQ